MVVAQHIATGERVAMKILDKEALLAGGGATRFPREVAALRRLSHPCTVRLISVLASKASLFMVMELVQGGDLYDRIAHEGALPVRLGRGIGLCCSVQGLQHVPLDFQCAAESLSSQAQAQYILPTSAS